ncbi:SgcJ/EcaC family oxidoreductase [Streptomyces cavernicola]|uniref:SgcJ/EcaC family oxidoreductase n=1 Tax=Streptomyces cavernicola TaxID=3043613 RepID=A0ABT6S2I9_9ACTN|nr:SgcJ/EcaC family oxidoreductase [Streptomyces sp. B-S-A6]MDI3402310.1 SgcJ/EcaC family oxidoreductase [Streptomyces sp. B-S-A6]
MSATPASPEPAASADADAAVRDLYERLLRAWNARDAAGYAALFEPGAALVGFDGSQVSGDRVEAHLAPIFADHPTASYVWKVRDVAQLADGVVLLRAVVGMVPPGRDELNPATNAVQSLVARRSSGQWRAVLFQNTPAQYHGRPELVEQHTEELRQVWRAHMADPRD